MTEYFKEFIKAIRSVVTFENYKKYIEEEREDENEIND